MKRAAISMDILAIIIIVLIGMTIFIVFFTTRSGGMFTQFSQLSPSEGETSKDACQIACNNAKLRTSCDSFNKVWCSKRYGNTEFMCYEKDIDCGKLDSEGDACDSCAIYLGPPA